MDRDVKVETRDERAPCVKQGDVLGHYRVLHQIGSGGIGAVFLARDEHLDRDVVLKVLAARSMREPNARIRFRREAFALSRLSHPEIATIFDFSTQNGVDYLVMEYVPGITLAERIKQKGKFREPAARGIGAKVCGALVEAHDSGVLHRDLSPHNIMLGPKRVVKVLDFGLAKMIGCDGADEVDISTPTATLSVTKHFAGTVPYIAPERLRGESADERADVYALGAILFEMVTGHKLYEGTTPAELVAATLDAPVPSVRTTSEATSEHLDRCISRALQKKPEDRYPTAREMLEELTPSPIDVARERRDALRGQLRVRKRNAWIFAALFALIAGYLLLELVSRDRFANLPAMSATSLVTGPDQEYGSALSPDARWVAYMSIHRGRYHLWVLPVSGGDPREVFSSNHHLLGHCWSGDGERLAIATHARSDVVVQLIPAFGGPSETSISFPAIDPAPRPIRWIGNLIYWDSGTDGLWVSDLETGEYRQVIPRVGEEGSRYSFAVCTGGHRVLYNVPEKDRLTLWVMKLPDGPPKLLTQHAASDLGGVWSGPQCCSRVIHSSNRTRQPDLWVTTLDGRSANITMSRETESAESASVDGRVLTIRRESRRGNLWAYHSDGNPPFQRLTADFLEDKWPAVAGFGHRVAFQRSARDIEQFDPMFQSQILVGDLGPDGINNARSLTERGGLPELSGDGRWLSYMRANDGRRELVLVDLESGRSERVDGDLPSPWLGEDVIGVLWSDLSWSPVSNTLFYVRGSQTRAEIRRVEAGFDREPVTIVQSGQDELCQPRIGFDGRTLAYLESPGQDPLEGPSRYRLMIADPAGRNSRELWARDRGTKCYWKLIGQRGDGSWLVLESPLAPSVGGDATIFAIDGDGTMRVVKSLSGFVGASTLDLPRDRIFLSYEPRESSVQDIYVLDLENRALTLMTDGREGLASYTHPQVDPEGRLLYARVEQNVDVNLLRFEY